MTVSIRFVVLAAVLGVIAAPVASVNAQENTMETMKVAGEHAANADADAGVAETPTPAAPVESAPTTTTTTTTTTTVTAAPPSAAATPAVAAPAGTHTYDMPAVADEFGATAKVAPSKETELIGDYKQPRWSAFRRFPTTRAYVRPAGTMAFEWWLESKLNLDDTSDVRHRSQYEFEFGLGHRLQFDVYLVTQQKGHSGPFELYQEKIELRYALADWGGIFLNPTLYAEFVREHEGPDKVEFKVLGAEQLGTRFFFATNLVWEHQLAGDLENEYAITVAGAYSLCDAAFSLGLEAKFEVVDSKAARFYDAFENYELLAGPSMWWSPVDPMRIMAVLLAGFEREGSTTVGIFEPTVIVGWEI